MKRPLPVVLLFILLASPAAFALTLTLQGNNAVSGGLNGYGPYQTGVGGEFTFVISDPSLISGYSSLASGQGGIANSFQSFCVEGGENIDASHPTYTADYNNHSVYSNVPLTRGAAYLYSQFAQGLLSGYSYTGGAAAREASADLLQRAIWHYMGGQESQLAYDSTNPFEVAAAGHFAGGEADADSAASTGYCSVYVLNLWDYNGRAAQDQLIYTTGAIPNAIPDGGLTAMLLGLGFTGVAFLSRRVRRS